eukprot:171285_1
MGCLSSNESESSQNTEKKRKNYDFISTNIDGLSIINKASYLTLYGFIRKYSPFTDAITSDPTICNLCLLYYYDNWTLEKNTSLFYHTDCLKHETISIHPEKPQRCSSSYSMLTKYKILKQLTLIEPREATRKELSLTHKQSHINTIFSTINKPRNGYFDGDTFYNKYSKRAALLAAGASIDLITGILLHKYNNGFALIRPPGHHCEHNKPMGFCLFNNIVVAINVAHNRNLCTKTLIVDWDVHHGNGTQNMFYDNENVLYFSVHRYDNGKFYPSTGNMHDVGNGFNINVPLNVGRKGFGDKEYLLIWKDILLPICQEFNPDIIVISAGFDACIGDPLGGMNVTPPCYGLLTRLLLNKCKNVAVILEGGYNLKTMPRAICCVNYALLIGPKQQIDEYDVNEFENECLKYIQDIGVVEDDIEGFSDWKTEYKHLLKVKEKKNEYVEKHKKQSYSNYKICKEQVKMVLLQHCKYWKCIQAILDDEYA